MSETVELAQLSVKELLCRYNEIIGHLVKREVCTTRDSPIGGYGEWLVARAFAGKRQKNSNKGVDVVAPGGVRLQVKTRWLAGARGSRQLGAIRNIDKQGFDFIVALLLDKDLQVAEAYQISHAAVARLATHTAYTNSHRLILSPTVCRDGECRDITAKLRAADPEP